jgi:anaerobic selenocysteine-containing dehydrogenase
MRRNPESEKKVLTTTCKSCHGGFGVLVEAIDEVITHIEGNPDSTTRVTICSKGLSTIQHIDNPYCITYLVREQATSVKGNGYASSCYTCKH